MCCRPMGQPRRRGAEYVLIPHEDGLGRVVHFHPFRKTWQTPSAGHGENQRVAPKSPGPSDPGLTANVYTDIPALLLHLEVAKIPLMSVQDGSAVTQHEAPKLRRLLVGSGQVRRDNPAG